MVRDKTWHEECGEERSYVLNMNMFTQRNSDWMLWSMFKSVAAASYIKKMLSYAAMYLDWWHLMTLICNCNTLKLKQTCKIHNYVNTIFCPCNHLSWWPLFPSLYLVVHTPPPPPLSQSQTGLGKSPVSSSWNHHCQWSEKLWENDKTKRIRRINDAPQLI